MDLRPLRMGGGVTCSFCAAPAVRALGVDDYCGDHLDALYATFQPSVFAYNGRGRRTGTLRPEHGHHAAEIECNACAATWVGNPGDPCHYCTRSYLAMLDHQADLVLEPPDVNPDDARWADTLNAWGGRLEVAIAAGIVDERRATLAWERANRKKAA